MKFIELLRDPGAEVIAGGMVPLAIGKLTELVTDNESATFTGFVVSTAFVVHGLIRVANETRQNTELPKNT